MPRKVDTLDSEGGPWIKIFLTNQVNQEYWLGFGVIFEDFGGGSGGGGRVLGVTLYREKLLLFRWKVNWQEIRLVNFGDYRKIGSCIDFIEIWSIHEWWIVKNSIKLRKDDES